MLLPLIVLTFLSLTTSAPQDIDSSADQQKVQATVVNWADDSFGNHEEYKFENFKAFYTDDFYIQSMRLESYGKRIKSLERKKKNGSYKGSDEDFKADITKLKLALENAKNTIDNVDRVTYYQIHFWSNIQTNDGITVYYEIILKLDNNYNITEAMEGSSIGKKSSATKIVYKKDSNHIAVIEKT